MTTKAIDGRKNYPPKERQWFERKYHLIESDKTGRTLCGRKSDSTQTVQDFLDWGFDGESENLCEHCERYLNMRTE